MRRAYAGLRPPPAQAAGRGRRGVTPLGWALVASVLAHGALLGLHLADPARAVRAWRDTPLEVILVNARTAEAPVQALALAQQQIAGGGEAAHGRSSSPLPLAPQLQLGTAPDEARRRIDTLQDQQQQLLTQLRRELASLPPPDPRRDTGTPAERAQEEQQRLLLRQLAEIEKRINDDSLRPKKRYLGPATQEVLYARYYDALRLRIEERGTRDFPEQRGRKLYGELTMNVTIDARGHVVEAEIVQPSASRALDQRAIAIVSAASPFGSFTPAMQAQADQIVITSRFRFTRDAGLQASVSSAP